MINAEIINAEIRRLSRMVRRANRREAKRIRNQINTLRRALHAARIA